MSAAFRPHPKIKVEVIQIGIEKAPVLVIDNFVSDPMRLVDEAVAAFALGSRRQSNFPGIVCQAPDAYARDGLDFLLPLLSKVFALKGGIKNGGCTFQLMTTEPQDLGVRQRVPHFDLPDVNLLASVHFLCAPKFKGTAFYRHNQTGFEIITADRVTPFETSLAAELVEGDIQGYISDSTQQFTQIASFEAVFNRAIFFCGATLHSGSAEPAHGFDPDPRNGRLTANTFLQFAY